MCSYHYIQHKITTSPFQSWHHLATALTLNDLNGPDQSDKTKAQPLHCLHAGENMNLIMHEVQKFNAMP